MVVSKKGLAYTPEFFTISIKTTEILPAIRADFYFVFFLKTERMHQRLEY